MTFLIKCDGCGKIQEAPCNSMGDPFNPEDDETGNRWFSRTPIEDPNHKTIHACKRGCIKDNGLVMPI